MNRRPLIAQHRPKDAALMVINRATGSIEHRRFDIVYLDPGDVLVINDSKVIPTGLW